MASRDLDGVRVAILLDNDFEQVEMTEPRKALEDAGASCRLVSPRQQVTGVKHDKQQDTFNVDLPLERANPEEFDAVLLPGGALNADSLRVVTKADLIAMKRRAAADPKRRRSKALRDQADIALLEGDVPQPDEGW